MRKPKWILAAVPAVAVALTVLWVQPKVHARSEKDLFVIKTWSRKDCSVTPWYVTEKLGYFAQEGIRLEYTGETQPAIQIPSILRGNNDVGDAHPNTIAVAKAGGARITGVVEGGIEPTDPRIDAKYRHMWWFVNPSKYPGVKSFADLKKVPGKLKFSTITRNICTDFATNLLAKKYGIPKEKIEWVTMPDVQAIQALKQGLVDVSAVHPPFYKGMQDVGARKIADTFETGVGAAAGITYYYFRDDFIKKHPDKVAAFSRAIVRGQRWANANPQQAAKLTEEAIGVPVTGNHYYSAKTAIDERLAAPWIAELEESKVIPRGKVTTSTLVTHEIEKINLARETAQKQARK